MNIDSSLANDTYFPHYSARDSLKLWMNTYLYFTDPDSSVTVVEWAEDLFSQTDTSWIRDAVEAESSDSTEDETTEDGSSESESSLEDDPSNATDSDSEDVSEDVSDDASISSTDASDIVVYDKAGWIDGVEDDALCDAGIIVEGDTAYLITIMTGAPDSETSRANVTNLAFALWSVRDSLSSSDYVAAS